MLHSVKADLLWGKVEASDEIPAVASASSTTTLLTTTTPSVVKGHVRRPSSVSVASTNSSTSGISDTESDTGIENDSGIEESAQDGASFGDRTEQVAHNFRRHLDGLTRSLRQMTDAAQYLTSRYQHDIGGPV